MRFSEREEGGEEGLLAATFACSKRLVSRVETASEAEERKEDHRSEEEEEESSAILDSAVALNKEEVAEIEEESEAAEEEETGAMRVTGIFTFFMTRGSAFPGELASSVADFRETRNGCQQRTRQK